MKYVIYCYVICIVMAMATLARAEITVYQGQIYTDLPGFNGPTIQSMPPATGTDAYNNYFNQGF